LAEPSAIRELVRDLDIRWAVAELRVGLAEAGMLRYPLLGSTRAARRRLQVLRKAFPLPASRRDLPDDERLLAVALHGETALRVLVPRFALRAGLTERVSLRDRRPLRHSPRGEAYGSAGHLYCGGGSGGGCGGGGPD
ncbi:TIGR04222 domain-containing membrane protein, partial [Streptomyces pilosus]